MKENDGTNLTFKKELKHDYFSLIYLWFLMEIDEDYAI